MKWIPVLQFSVKSLKQLVSYGFKVLATILITTIFDNLVVLVVGKKYSPDQYAYYDQGRKYPQVIISNINSSIESVLFPAMAKSQDEPENLKKLIRQSIICSEYVLLPLLTWLAVCSRELIIFLLTEKWLPAVPYMPVFCFIYALYPFDSANINALKATGKSDLLLKLEIIKKIYSVAIFLVTMNHGIFCIAIGLMIIGFINSIVNTIPIRGIANYSLWNQLKDIAPTLLLSFVFGVSVYLLGYLPINSILLSLIIRFLGGFIIYLVLSYITKNEGYLYIKNIVSSYLK